MNQNHQKVPNIITGKDLDYLSDMFQWNYGALKLTNDSLNFIQDVQIKEIFQRAFQTFNSNINIVLTTLQLQGGNNES